MTSTGSRPTRRTDRSPARAPQPEGAERLQKALARAGYGSRRSVEDLIRQGRVRIGTRVAELGDRVDARTDSVFVDDVPVPLHPDVRHYVLNKPAGVTTTLHDVHARKTLTEFLPPGPRVFPVGRLDRESEGLLLLTNDGELANRIQHPRYGVEKEYLAEVEGSVPRSVVRALERGVELEDGPARASRAAIEAGDRTRTAISVVMAEGRKREVRRMLAAVGFPVRRLVRVRIGPVRLGSLSPGAVRPLTTEEISDLYRATGLDRAAPAGPNSGRKR
jgi:23S rRNA pseudouridine2605 synthase